MWILISEGVKPECITDELEYEYIIVTTELYYQEIVSYATSKLNIPQARFLHGKIFKLPYFNWKDYIEIYKSKISIIAEACYGGILSHHLGLPFFSPFVNVRIGYEKNDYYKMLENLDDYMQRTPERLPQSIGYLNKEWPEWKGV